MSRVLTFRQNANDLNTLEDINSKLIEVITRHATLEIGFDNVEEWKRSDNTSIFERRYYIQKQGRKLSWNDVMGIVNSIKPVPYDYERGNVVDNKFAYVINL